MTMSRQGERSDAGFRNDRGDTRVETVGGTELVTRATSYIGGEW